MHWPPSSCVPGGHAVQLVAVPFVQAAQEASHHSHVGALALPLAYLPVGHELTHEPSSKNGVPLSGQVRHAVLWTLEHVWQLLWHATHEPKPPGWMAATQLVGQLATQVASCKKGASMDEQLRQSVAAGPEQVPHAAKQGSHVCDVVLAHLPAGTQLSRQRPGGSLNG